MKDRLNILQIVSDLSIGGVSSVITTICNYLVEEHDVTIGIYKTMNVKRPDNLDERVNILYFSSFSEYIHLLKNEYDIIHIHMMLKSGIFCLITKLWSKSITVVHSHTSQDYHSSLIFHYGYKPVSMLLIKLFSDIKIACSDYAGKYLFGTKYNLLVNAINPNKYSFNNEFREIIRKQYNIDKDEFVIGFVGHIHAVKNLLFIAKVIKELNLKNVRFLIVGGTTEDVSIENELKTYEFVTITGMVNNAYQFYSAFDVFVLPSLFEGMPMVAIEAQANGLKCLLSSNITTLVNIDGNCNFLDITQPNEWLSALKDNLNRPRNTINCVFNTQFDSQNQAKRLLGLYCEQLNKRG